ncbi:MAG: hypothetical protein ACPG5B_14335 [Chitinophagales bacterium]
MKHLIQLESNEKEIINIPIWKLLNESDIEFENKDLALTEKMIERVKIKFTYQDNVYWGKTDRMIIHQIGKRIYGNKYRNAYHPILQNWTSDFNSNLTAFKTKIVNTL